MAATYAVTNLVRDVSGSKRRNYGTATATGTYSTGGDSMSAAAFGLRVLDNVISSVLQEGTPLAFQPIAVIASDKQSVSIRLFGTNAVPGAAVADPQVTAGTTITGYAFTFEAVGR